MGAAAADGGGAGARVRAPACCRCLGHWGSQLGGCRAGCFGWDQGGGPRARPHPPRARARPPRQVVGHVHATAGVTGIAKPAIMQARVCGAGAGAQHTQHACTRVHTDARHACTCAPPMPASHRQSPSPPSCRRVCAGQGQAHTRTRMHTDAQHACTRTHACDRRRHRQSPSPPGWRARVCGAGAGALSVVAGHACVHVCKLNGPVASWVDGEAQSRLAPAAEMRAQWACSGGWGRDAG